LTFVIQNKTYNVQAPFQSSLIKEIIAKQWFPSPRSEGIKYSKYFKDIPTPIIALVVSAVSFLTLCAKDNNVLNFSRLKMHCRNTEQELESKLTFLRKLSSLGQQDYILPYTLA
jgi:hypothetical protein